MITGNIYETELEDPLQESNFHRIKIVLKNRLGESYNQFKKTLTPDYAKAWRDIAIGWILLSVTVLLGGWLLQQTLYTGWLIFITIVTSAFAGFLVSYLVNFFHEAAHFNLSADKNKNEIYANLFIGLLIGQSIQYYRIVHWEHHKSLGTTTDTERSYFESPGFKFMLASVTGIRAIKLLLLRNNFVTKDIEKFTRQIKSISRKQLLFSIVFHLVILTVMAFFRQWWLIAAWCIAIGCWYPLFGSLRQVLEHRDDHADKKTNYSSQPHGKFTRIFGDSLFDKTFGSAGFNKHLLHHLEPQVSYTRLDDLEKFLGETIIGHHIRKKRASYWTTFTNLFNR